MKPQKCLSLLIGQETREFETASTNGTSENVHARDVLTPDEIIQLENSL